MAQKGGARLLEMRKPAGIPPPGFPTQFGHFRSIFGLFRA
jgi:hypothetical protein